MKLQVLWKLRYVECQRFRRILDPSYLGTISPVGLFISRQVLNHIHTYLTPSVRNMASSLVQLVT